MKKRAPFPPWLHREMPTGENFLKTRAVLQGNRLHAVCEEARCPNRAECYSKKTATFLALGKACTRACAFCSIDFAKTPPLPDLEEPHRIARAVETLGLRHVVITMVTRDDLPDGGSAHLAKIISTIREECPDTSIEVLTSDFSGNMSALDGLLAVRPEIFNHNVETVRRLTPRIRHKATYDRSLSLLLHVKKREDGPFVKSGMMVGLGETDAEVEETLVDLRDAGCDIVTIGQYLQSDTKKRPVHTFVEPEKFAYYKGFGRKIGIEQVYAGPFVRSSYNADLLKERLFRKGGRGMRNG